MLWGLTLQPGELYTEVIKEEVQLKIASLDSRNVGADPASTFSQVILQTENSEYVLCTLIHGSQFQQYLDIKLVPGEKINFCVGGKYSVHLLGYSSHTPSLHEEFEQEDTKDLLREEGNAAPNENDGHEDTGWQPVVNDPIVKQEPEEIDYNMQLETTTDDLLPTKNIPEQPAPNPDTQQTWASSNLQRRLQQNVRSNAKKKTMRIQKRRKMMMQRKRQRVLDRNATALTAPPESPETILDDNNTTNEQTAKSSEIGIMISSVTSLNEAVSLQGLPSTSQGLPPQPSSSSVFQDSSHLLGHPSQGFHHENEASLNVIGEQVPIPDNNRGNQSGVSPNFGQNSSLKCWPPEVQVVIPESIYKYALKTTQSKAIRMLTQALFSDYELKACTITGRSKKGGKQPLDINRLRVIEDFMMMHFNCQPPEVRRVIGDKCRELCRIRGRGEATGGLGGTYHQQF